MPKFIALLRGINVGKAKRVAMADLKKLFADLGFTEIATILNSGNVIFSGKKPVESKLEAAFTECFGFSSNMTVVSAAEIVAVIDGNPIAEIPDPTRFFIAFIKDAAVRDKLVPMVEKAWHPEAIKLGERMAWMWCPQGALDSPLNTAVNKALKDGVTVRNYATVLKIRAAL